VITVVIGVAVFAAQVIAYRYISSKLRTRAAYRNRLASLRTVEHAPRVAPQRFVNRPGED
tara:strand:- start:1344 stop:1523 length:180 start_codon:yes stop_codon:yes gene_type:complete